MRVKELSLVYRTLPGVGTVTRRLNTPRDSAAFLTPILAHEACEVLGIVCLSTRYDALSWHEVARGSVNTCHVQPREVFIPALLTNAYGLVLAHNHPSGDPTPSPEDVELTRKIAAAGALLGMTVVDHLIIAEHRYFSFKEGGQL